MSHHNNHERTTVAIREELEKAIGSSVPGNRREEVFAKIERVVDRYSSPYPDPSFLQQIEALAPGSAAEIVRASIQDLDHRRSVENRQLDLKSQELSLVKGIADGEFKSTGQGRLYGFLAYLGCLSFSAGTYYLGSEALALAGFGAAALGIVSQLIRGQTSSAVTVTAERVSEEKPQIGKAG
jgi:hypothetical protein